MAGSASPQITSAPKEVKLTVGNVTKGTVLLYTIATDGKLTFVRELAHGEAFDQKAPAGQRWVALHAEKRAGESFVVPDKDGTWLLR